MNCSYIPAMSDVIVDKDVHTLSYSLIGTHTQIFEDKLLTMEDDVLSF